MRETYIICVCVNDGSDADLIYRVFEQSPFFSKTQANNSYQIQHYKSTNVLDPFQKFSLSSPKKGAYYIDPFWFGPITSLCL